MTGPELSVGRGVIVEMTRLAALEVPGVLRVARGGPAWLDLFRGPPIQVRLRKDQVHLRVWVVARPGAALPAVVAQARAAIGATIERLLGLRLGSVTVVVDGVGG